MAEAQGENESRTDAPGGGKRLVIRPDYVTLTLSRVVWGFNG